MYEKVTNEYDSAQILRERVLLLRDQLDKLLVNQDSFRLDIFKRNEHVVKLKDKTMHLNIEKKKLEINNNIMKTSL